MPSQARLVLLALSLLALATACSKLPSVHFNSPFGRSDWVEVRESAVVTGPPPALVFSLVNRKSQVLSVQVEIDEIEGGGDCQNTFLLEPGRTIRYSCRQRTVTPGNRYRGDLRVFTDRGATKLVERLHRILVIEAGPDDELFLVGQAAK